jgi:hypothetical protein
LLNFGKDALTSYSGQKFDISWEDFLELLYHIYSKEYKKKRKTIFKVRDEDQEYPNKSLKDALMDNIKDDDDNGDKTFLIGL